MICGVYSLHAMLARATCIYCIKALQRHAMLARDLVSIASKHCNGMPCWPVNLYLLHQSTTTACHAGPCTCIYCIKALQRHGHAGPCTSIHFIIIKKDWQCKAGRGKLKPYQSEHPSPTLPTYRGKKEKGKIVEDKKRESNYANKSIASKHYNGMPCWPVHLYLLHQSTATACHAGPCTYWIKALQRHAMLARALIASKHYNGMPCWPVHLYLLQTGGNFWWLRMSDILFDMRTALFHVNICRGRRCTVSIINIYILCCARWQKSVRAGDGH